MNTFRKKASQVFVIIFLLVSTQVNPRIITHSSIVSANNLASMGNGAWMHIDTFYQKNEKQKLNFIQSLKMQNITNIFILGKNIDGTVNYPTSIGLNHVNNDFMTSFVKLLKNNQFKVYFYYPINTDPSWLKQNPEDTSYQIGKQNNLSPAQDPNHKIINLTSQKYQNYISGLILEAIQNYPIDGIQLDYIRYPNGSYGFSPYEINEGMRRNISMDRVKELTYQTFVSPGDWKTLLNKYDENDPDIVAWAKLREDIVTNFVTTLANKIKKTKKQIGCTVVSSGATSKAYTAIHFGQSWERLSQILNFMTPMAYHGDTGNVEKFISDICLGAINKIKAPCKLAIGLQANSTSSEKLNLAIHTVNQLKLSFVLFRIGTFALTGFDFLPKNQDQVILRLYIYNHLEAKTLKSLLIKKTANIVSLVNYPSHWNFQQKGNDYIQLKTDQFITSGNSVVLDIECKISWQEIDSYFNPLIIVSDEKNEFPTINVANFEMNQMTIELNNHQITYNQEKLDSDLIKNENQKSWILIAGLDGKFGIKTDILNQKTTISCQDFGLFLDFTKMQGYFILGKEKFTLQNPLFFAKPGYLPLLELMDLLRIQVIYNSKENSIFCLKLKRDYFCSFYGNLNTQSALELWITDAREIIVDIENLLSTSFYQATKNQHLQGRIIRIVSKKGIFSVRDIESIISLIQDDTEPLLVPDYFCYFVQPGDSYKEIPFNRELFTKDISLDSHFKKLKYVSFLVLDQTDKLEKSCLSSPIYLDLGHVDLLLKQDFLINNTSNIRALYCAINQKF